ncbi:MAG: ribosomal protein S18-alanine N-acetyltransferase [Bacteriovoracia bacterium]
MSETQNDSQSIRPATDDDLTQMAEIDARVQKAPWTVEGFRGELSKPYARAWVLTDDETDSRILGYVVFWLLPEGAEILTVAVDLAHRGLGYGIKLIRSVINEALRADLKQIQLEVRKSNAAALQLYQKSQFTVTHVRKAFYSDGEDAYVMTLPLSGARDSF